jgi:DNA polymerase-3 subunit delta
MYFNQLRMLGQAVQSGQTAQNAVRSLRPPIHFKLQNAFMLQLKRWQPDQATNILDRLQDIEIAIKSTGINERTLASQGLLSCCLRAKG